MVNRLSCQWDELWVSSGFVLHWRPGIFEENEDNNTNTFATTTNKDNVDDNNKGETKFVLFQLVYINLTWYLKS